MKSRRSYRRTDVKKIDPDQLRELACSRGGPDTAVGLDIGKDEIVVCVRWPDGHFTLFWDQGHVIRQRVIDVLVDEKVAIVGTICQIVDHNNLIHKMAPLSLVGFIPMVMIQNQALGQTGLFNDLGRVIAPFDDNSLFIQQLGHNLKAF